MIHPTLPGCHSPTGKEGGDGYWLGLNILYSLWKQLLVMPLPPAFPKPAVVYWEWYGTNLSWNQFKSKLGVLSVMCPEGLCLGILYHAGNLVNQIKLQFRWDQTVALTRDKRLKKSRGFIFHNVFVQLIACDISTHTKTRETELGFLLKTAFPRTEFQSDEN